MLVTLIFVLLILYLLGVGPLALGPLTETQKRIIALRFFEDRTIDQTAADVGRTGESVKKIQMRGIRRMREQLAASA